MKDSKIKKVLYLMQNWVEKNIFVVVRFGTPKYSTKFVKRNTNLKNITAVEIGVLAGVNSKSILKNLDIKKIYLVDIAQPQITRAVSEFAVKNKVFPKIDYQDWVFVK